MAERFTGYGMPSIDFDVLGNLGNTYDVARKGAVRERVLSEIGQGKLDPAVASQKAFAAGDVETGISLARLAESRSNRSEDRAWRATESKRAQDNADRSYSLQERQLNRKETPPGFTQGVSGDLVPTPGGPADPAYLERTSEAKQKPRQFSVGDITKLSEEGGKFANVTKFADTFEDKFAGYKSSALGGAVNTAGRYLPESVVGKDIAEGAGWWQGYDRYKNVVRNELFGSALTKTEKSAFEKADINPGMDPKQIKNNLRIQQEIATNGLKRKANALISSGYDPAAISQAYGVDVREIGATATGRGKPAEPSQGSLPQFKSPQEVARMVQTGKLKSGDSFLDADGNTRIVP